MTGLGISFIHCLNMAEVEETSMVGDEENLDSYNPYCFLDDHASEDERMQFHKMMVNNKEIFMRHKENDQINDFLAEKLVGRTVEMTPKELREMFAMDIGYTQVSKCFGHCCLTDNHHHNFRGEPQRSLDNPWITNMGYERFGKGKLPLYLCKNCHDNHFDIFVVELDQKVQDNENDSYLRGHVPALSRVSEWNHKMYKFRQLSLETNPPPGYGLMTPPP